MNWKCEHAESGCNYPEGECNGLCEIKTFPILIDVSLLTQGFDIADTSLVTTTYKPPEGWKLVPVEMTNAMGLAGQAERKKPHSSLAQVYRAMLDAAPEYEVRV